MTRDAFLEGLPHEFQVQLRLSESTASKSVKELSEDVHRLQMAGIGAKRSSEVMSASSCGPRQVFSSSHLSIGVETLMCQEVDDDRSTDVDSSGLVNVVEASGSRQKPIWVAVAVVAKEVPDRRHLVGIVLFVVTPTTSVLMALICLTVIGV